jgi:hypothetical protein
VLEAASVGRAVAFQPPPQQLHHAACLRSVFFLVPQQTEIPAQRNAKIQKVPAVPQVGGVVFLLVDVLCADAAEEKLVGRPSQDSASQWKCDTSTRGGCENCNSC